MKIIKDNVTTQSKYMEIHSTVYEDKEGKHKEWSWVSRPNNVKAVMIVPIVIDKTEDGGYKGLNRICVIKEFRVPLINDYEWGFPAGLIDVSNESTEECIARELKEETGLDLDYIYEISPYTYNSAGITDESIAMAFVRAKGTLSQDKLESSEEIETFLMDQSEVLELLHTDNKFGAKAWLIMRHFAKHNHVI